MGTNNSFKELYVLINQERVGVLRYDSLIYTFKYLEEAKRIYTKPPIFNFPEWDKKYKSKELFAVFVNRIINSKRPDYDRVVRELGLDPNNLDLIEFLIRTKGIRQTDNISIMPIKI